MHLLVLGGTRFVGLHAVRAALAAGHTVDVFHRGQSPAPEGARSLIGDRNGDMTALEAGSWDAVIDVSAYLPRQAREAAQLLRGRVGRYVFVSTVSVYRDSEAQTAEDAPLKEPPPPEVETITGETYGGLKTGCERALEAVLGGSLIHVRPTYVVGPEDYTDRFASWLRRLRQGGKVAAIGDPATPLSFIDGRDLGAFLLQLAGSDAVGAVNASGPAEPISWGELLRHAAEVAGTDPEIVWLDPDWLEARGVLWQGFPMWNPLPFRDAAPYSLDRAKALGLRHRPVRDTLRDALAWHEAQGTAKVGLDPKAEAELIAAWESEA